MKNNILAVICFLLMVFPGLVAAQNPAPADVDDNSSLLPDEIKSAEEEVNVLTDKHSDATLMYSYALRSNLEELMREKSQTPQPVDKAQPVADPLKKIADWEVLRQNEWDLSLALLIKKSQLRQLQYDHLMEVNQKLSQKSQEQGNQKRVQEFKEGRDFINQMKDLENKSLELNKELLLAREKYDFTTANEIRKKLKDLRDITSELKKKTNNTLKQIQGNQTLEEQNI